jgi:hypothetical protein
MKYTVKTPDGELTYSSFGAVEHAWLNGLVGPEDDILEEGHTQWRKASSYPLLMQARRHGDAVWGGTQHAYLLAVVVLGSVALYLLVKGHWIGIPALFVLAFMMTRITWNAYKKTKPHR